MLAGQVVACALMLTHFALLEAETGAAVMGVAGLQAALAIPLGTHPRFKYIYLASLLLTPLVSAVTWHRLPSVFSSLALMIVCVANFQLDQVRQRAILIGAIFAWIAHNFLVASVPGLVSNSLALAVSTHMLFRTIKAARNAASEPA
ncbi:YgjV family protein [Litchfieldella qijiaojingensis]|uniref:YgjV family protein n=1 Tax=Litchfieldella qijiaojingensis TaxID=980347 RepID=UPI00227D8BEE|nr:YgjV family protein [Halomonas qijiaojingensis]